jgi:[1-hydroxy-2-(trimethylamino)ethyl]phosphonate dioxygenase
VTPAGAAPETVEALLSLYDLRGDAHYGEEVTQSEHAMQCAARAREDGAADELVCAALLHDVGHLLEEDPPVGADDRHEAIGAQVLAKLFGRSVAAPVALHVTAKRWRCAVDPAYVATLSAASIASLELQGGALDADARARFEARPSFRDAVRLRAWDDDAKELGISSGVVRDHVELLTRLAVAHTRCGT